MIVKLDEIDKLANKSASFCVYSGVNFEFECCWSWAERLSCIRRTQISLKLLTCSSAAKSIACTLYLLGPRLFEKLLLQPRLAGCNVSHGYSRIVRINLLLSVQPEDRCGVTGFASNALQTAPFIICA